mgnify:FL=1
METFVVWLQLASALTLLSDAYLSPPFRQRLDEKIMRALGGYCDSYRQSFLRRDRGFLIAFLIAWALFFIFGYAGHWIRPASSYLESHLGLSYVSLVLVAAWALGFLYLFSMAMAGFSHLDKLLNILIKFPAAYALYKAPKGPLYAGGFALLVISHLIQLARAYGY